MKDMSTGIHCLRALHCMLRVWVDSGTAGKQRKKAPIWIKPFWTKAQKMAYVI